MDFFGKAFLHAPLNIETVSLLGKINHYQGQLEVYEKEFPTTFHKLQQSTRHKHIKCFINMYQGMNLSNTRLKTLIEQDRFPQNSLEEEITCYHDAFTLIHDQYNLLPINVTTILEIHFQLFKYATSDSGTFRHHDIICHGFSHKNVPMSHHQALPAINVPIYLEKLCIEYDQLLSNSRIDFILLIVNFIFHFTCIVPFDKGNGRVARLLLCLLLLKGKYSVVKYISLDSIIKKFENSYYEALYKSSANWFSQEHNLTFITEGLLRIIHAAYEELHTNLIHYPVDGKRKIQLRDYILKQQSIFSKEDIRQIFPTVSESMLQRTFQCLQEEKKIRFCCKVIKAKLKCKKTDSRSRMREIF
ncbi:Fic family protein [Bacillus thuringiensis]|uniref:Fic family protein n=1 Tax=Bacillus thuringiensis TaxID=1428 RepID=UPI003BF649A9